MNFPFEKEIILENAVTLLRPLLISDIDTLLPVAMEDKTLLQFSPKPIHSYELLKSFIEMTLSEKEKGIRYPFIIFDKTKNAYAGSTSFMNISNDDERLEIGSTWIGRGFQRTGLNRNCKYLLLSFAFDKLDAKRVEFKTDERNEASKSAIQKVGGKFEGILRSHTVMSDGFRRNTVYYSILKEEWSVLQKNF